MSTLDETWAWLYTPLQELKSDTAENPDKPWAERRAFLLERLGLTDSADHPLTDELFRWLDELPDDERGTMLAGEQLDTTAHELAQRHSEEPAATAAAETTFDEAAWYAFLASHASQWDGTAESWDQFTEWLRYYADENGFGAPTGSLIDSLDVQAVADRVGVLAQYGVAIPASAEQHAEVPTSDEFADTHMADLLAEDPQFADIPEERRLELIAQVLGEAAKSGQ
jgi:hypothetical protein